LHTTALGKAMIACMPDGEINRILGRGKTLRGLTGNSIRSRSQLDADIAGTRERGWGLAREESHPGLTAVGSAILDKDNRPIAAISVSFLDHPPDPRRLTRLAAIVMAVAGGVSGRIVEYGHFGATLKRHSRDMAARAA
jgi:DNA-binding IclR family transcriptional regulator